MRHWRPLVAGFLFLAVVAVTAARIARNLDVAGHPDEDKWGLQDFRDAFYYASRALVDGVNPYDPAAYLARYPVARPTSPYSPHALLLHLPFGLLPYRTAQLAYEILNLVLVVWLARACLLAVRGRAGPAAVLALATLVLLSRPTHQTLFLGQITLIVVAGVHLALFEEERRPWLAAAGVALACMKPTYGAPLVVALLVLGRRRTTLRGVLLAAVASLPALLLLARAAGGVGPWFDSVVDSYTIMDSDEAVNAATSTIRLDTVAMIERLAGRPLGGIAGALVSAALLAAGSAAAARLGRPGGREGRVAAAAAVCLTVLVCVYHQAYDAILLLLPITALALGGDGLAWRGRGAWRFVLLALMAVPMVNYLATDTLLNRLDPALALRTIITSANGVALAAAFVIVVGLAFAPAVARIGRAPDAGGRAGRPGAKVWTALAVLAFAGLALVICLRIVRNLDTAGQPLEQRYGLQDFRDNVYYASRAFLDGANPYDFPAYREAYPVARPLPPYTPINFLVHAPYAFLPYRVSEAAYVAVNLGLVLLFAALAARLAGLGLSTATVAGIGALLLLTRPVHQTLFIGQCALLVGMASAVALLEARRRPWLSVAGFVVAALKPSFAGPLAIMMVARGDARVALVGAAVAGGAALLLGIPPAIAAGGPRALLDSVRAGMATMRDDPSFNEISSIIRIDLGGLVGRIVDAPLGAAGGALLALAVLGPAAWLCWRLRGLERDPDRMPSFGLACFAILLCVYHQAYDAVLLALPAAALLAPGAAGRTAGGGNAGRGPAWTSSAAAAATAPLRWTILALLAVPAANYLATNTLMRQIDPPRPMWLAITSANGLAILLAGVLWGSIAFRAAAAPAPGPRGSA